MYALRSTIKCPVRMKNEILEALRKLNITAYEIEEVPYGLFIKGSRLYWDYVFPEMLEDKKTVLYISYDFPDTDEGRKASHHAELNLGWIPQNVRYVEV